MFPDGTKSTQQPRKLPSGGLLRESLLKLQAVRKCELNFTQVLRQD